MQRRRQRCVALVALACAALTATACDRFSDRTSEMSEAVPAVEAPSAEEIAFREAKQATRKQATDEALEILKRASDFLNGQQTLRFEAILGFDAVQPWGQKLEFGGTRRVTLRRPDHLRVEVQNREGGEQTLIFDGQRIAVDIPGENAYALVERPGSFAEALDHLIQELGTPAPLVEFIQGDFYAAIVPLIRSGIDLTYSFSPRARASVGFYHLSNADIYETNGGANTLLFSLATSL